MGDYCKSTNLEVTYLLLKYRQMVDKTLIKIKRQFILNENLLKRIFLPNKIQ